MSRFRYLLAVSLSVWVATNFVHIADALSGVAFVSTARAQSQQVGAQSVPVATREIPARTIPVPDTVSPQMQAVIARPFDPSFNLVPQTAAEWKARVEKVALATVAGLPKLREALGVTVQPATMAGVKVFIVTP